MMATSTTAPLKDASFVSYLYQIAILVQTLQNVKDVMNIPSSTKDSASVLVLLATMQLKMIMEHNA